MEVAARAAVAAVAEAKAPVEEGLVVAEGLDWAVEEETGRVK